MILALLCIAIGDASHASLHPADAEIYIEVPDVKAVLEAYPRAPAFRIVASEGAANIAELAKDLGVDLRAIVEGVLPVSDPDRPEDRWWPWSEAHRFSASVSNTESALAAGASPAGETAWVICDFESTDATAQARLALVAMGGRDAQAVGELTIAGANYPVLSIGSPLSAFSENAWVATVGPRLVLGLGAARPADYAGRALVEDGGLAPKWAASALLSAPKGDADLAVLELLADRDELPAFVAANPLTAAAAVLAAPFLSARGRWRIALRGDRFVTDALFEPRGTAKTVLGAFSTEPAPKDAARLVSPEAVGAWITGVDLARVDLALATLLQPWIGDQPVLAGAPSEPRIADGLRPGVAIQFLPLQSLMSPTPRVVLAIELSDAAKFQAGLDAWLERARAANPGLQIERRPYRKVPTITLAAQDKESDAPSRGPGGLPFGASTFQPERVTIAVLADRVLIASTLTAARAEIKRLQDEGAEPVLHAGVQTLVHPPEAFEYSTMDWALFLASIFDGVRGLAPALAQNRAEPVDFDKLPTGAELFAPLVPTQSWSKRVDGRIQAHSESSFGPETPLGLAAMAFLGMNASRQSGTADVPVAQPDDGPTKDAVDATAESQRTNTHGSLREVRTAIAVYRSQLGREPATIADLLQKTDAFPDGFLKSGSVPKDAWGRDLVYSASKGDAAYSLYSIGSNGIDEQGSGDDVRLP